MKISRHAQELLENLWIYWVYLDGNDDEFIRRNMVEQNAIVELEDLNLVNFVDGNLRLTPEGFQESWRIIYLKIDDAIWYKSECLLNDHHPW